MNAPKWMYKRVWFAAKVKNSSLCTKWYKVDVCGYELKIYNEAKSILQSLQNLLKSALHTDFFFTLWPQNKTKQQKLNYFVKWVKLNDWQKYEHEHLRWLCRLKTLLRPTELQPNKPTKIHFVAVFIEVLNFNYQK